MSWAHTPGPWAGRPSNDPVCLSGAQSVGLEISFALAAADSRRDEYIANARLIAYAPDLLAALQEIADVTTPGDGVPNWKWVHDRAQAAIAKAVQP